MSARRSVLLAMALAAGPACVTPKPPYVFAPGEAKARVFVVDGDELSLLKGRTWYSVEVEKGTRYAWLPATEPVMLGRFLYYSGYQVSYSCYPMTAFMPEPGASYVMDVVVIDDGCLALLVREDPETRTGVSLEPSVERFRQ